MPLQVWCVCVVHECIAEFWADARFTSTEEPLAVSSVTLQKESLGRFMGREIRGNGEREFQTM